MKRYGNLFPQITDYGNLLWAAYKAQKGKKGYNYVRRFNFHREYHLLRLQQALKQGTYRPGAYSTFIIHEPKRRMISAAPYRDRVVHHALCNIIEPLWERAFIFDSYANRKAKGTHKAVLRYQQFARQNRYVLKMDIKSYFPSIDHEILKLIVRKKIKCPRTLALIDQIIDNSNPQETVSMVFPGDTLFDQSRRKGLPIGNLTSQFFANVYLNPLDHFIKRQLKCKHYIRYVDDFVLLGNDKKQLAHFKNEIIGFLQAYRLKLHENKSQVFQTGKGLDFLGHRVFPNYRLLKKENIHRFYRRFYKNIDEYNQGWITKDELFHRLRSWNGHAGFDKTYRLKKRIIKELIDLGIGPQ